MSKERPANWVPGRSASDKARLAVFNVLMAVEADGAYANIVLPKQLRAWHFGRRDSAYATNLAYGTLRMQGRWDAILEHCMGGRRIEETDLPVRILLRMGAHQLLEFGTAPHAAVNETVTLARNEVGTGASKFVNAVLHRVSERSLKEWQEVIRADAGGKANSVAFLSRWFSHPAWIIRALSQALMASGRPHKDILSVLKSDNTPAHVALVARDISLGDLESDIERGSMTSAPGVLVDSAVLLTSGAPHRVFAIKDGLAGVQDEGSQLIARTLANAPIEGRDSLWLDMCAGPGGKTATLASYAAKRGARIHANELHEHRLDLVADSVRRFENIVDLRLGDGAEIGSQEPGAYDRVLIDAPCTGIGALRRRPEARWRKEAGDALDLSVLQGDLLDSGYAALREGGVLCYSTCSPYLVETRAVVEAFLERTDAQLIDAGPLASQQAKVAIDSTDKMVQLWPDLHHSDAMFFAMITKPSQEKA
ncbi:16S rRNA (cytosine967-C5)-methyltransferase [Arcanobacterium wilhelmae]|uniref:16S rRNA (Cytosine967-C5)-methyltransferase n=1 Tax=Arcanobacterium wilhelmae TaxID=1803177 RepID=A0ABT9N933_9ACTO|nr:transcription antitermination factor NusB [Arcanobacterium wilhelmae]MDP9800025.1 16S rRNA (cytosine967-C5)-methyltransferase [Arcanobacterium wilhelmae]WFN89522.1 transcription antitermination factor NusB [Arcanobacterium wilhelmae]